MLKFKQVLRNVILISLLSISFAACSPKTAPMPEASSSPEVIRPGQPGKACTLEAKICADGSTVGRTGSNCEFAACPEDSPSPNSTPVLLPNTK